MSWWFRLGKGLDWLGDFFVAASSLILLLMMVLLGVEIGDRALFKTSTRALFRAATAHLTAGMTRRERFAERLAFAPTNSTAKPASIPAWPSALDVAPR